VSSVTRKYSHSGEMLFQDIIMILAGDIGLTTMIDPACVLRLSQITLPEIVFQHHPERRYFKDGIYAKKDVEVCRNAVDGLIREMALLRLDGYL